MKDWYLLAKKELHPSNNGEMNYCPYCLKLIKEQLKGTSKDFKDCITPLVYHKFMCVQKNKDNEEVKTIEEVWKCPRCSKNIFPSDFEIVYCLKTDGTRYKSEKENEQSIST